MFATCLHTFLVTGSLFLCTPDIATLASAGRPPNYRDVKKPTTLTAQTGKAFHSDLMAAAHAERAAHGAPVQQPTPDWRTLRSFVPSTPGQDGGAMINPIEYGADPTGVKDSTAAFQKAVSALLTAKRSNHSMISHVSKQAPNVNITDLGGATLHLQGGVYLISKALWIPPFYGNYFITGGTLRASPTFPANSYVIEIGGTSIWLVGQFANVFDVLLDGSGIAAGGIQVMNVMGSTLGPGLSVVNFHTIGINIVLGHENVINEAWVAACPYLTEEDPADNWRCNSSIGVKIGGFDGYLLDTIVYDFTRTGVVVLGGGGLLTSGLYVWNGGGVGLLSTLPFPGAESVTVQMRLVGCHFENAAVRLEAGRTDITDSFFYNSHVDMRVFSRIVITSNIFANNDDEPAFKLEVNDDYDPWDVVIKDNAGTNMTTEAVGQLTLSNSKSWEFDFSNTLIFPRPPHVQYTVESTSGFPRSVLRPVNGTQIVIETEEAVDATVTVWASQGEVRNLWQPSTPFAALPATTRSSHHDVKKPTTLTAQTGKAFHSDLMAAAHAERVAHGAPVQQPTPDWRTLRSFVPSTPGQDGGAMINPIEYGADPTGLTDSTAAFEKAVTALLTAKRASKNMSGGVVDLGGATLHLRGGEFMISAPVVIPAYYGNFHISGGTLRASPTFPTDRFLIEMGGESSVAQNIVGQYGNVHDIMLDGSSRAYGGIKIQNFLGATLGPAAAVSNFHGIGMQVIGGEETMVTAAWFTACYPGTYGKVNPSALTRCNSSVAVELDGTDHYVVNTVVYEYTEVGIIVKGEGAMLQGIHIWNSGGVGVSVQASHTRIIGPYMDGNQNKLLYPLDWLDISANDVVVQDGYFFYTYLKLRAPTEDHIFEDITVTNNYFFGNVRDTTIVVDVPKGYDWDKNVPHNVLVTSNMGTNQQTTGFGRLSLNNSKKWELDGQWHLVFPSAPVVKYTIETSSGFPQSVLRPVHDTQITIETEEAVDATVMVWATQGEPRTPSAALPATKRIGHHDVKKPTTLTAQTGKAFHSDLMAAAHAERAAHGAPVQQPTPGQDGGAMINPIEYGADPTGLTDSTAAFEKAVTALLTAKRASKNMSGVVVDLGGATLHLRGGEYLVSAPVFIPAYYGNFHITGGTLRASPTFPTDRFLIEMGGESSVAAGSDDGRQNIVGQFGDVHDIMLDGSSRAYGGIKIQNFLGATLGPAATVVNFHGMGVQLLGGYETQAVSLGVAACQSAAASSCKTGQSAIGIAVNGADNYIIDSFVYGYTGVGIIVNGTGTWLEGLKIENEGSVGLSIQAPHTMVVGCSFDGTAGGGSSGFTSLPIDIAANSVTISASKFTSSYINFNTATSSSISGIIITENTFLTQKPPAFQISMPQEYDWVKSPPSNVVIKHNAGTNMTTEAVGQLTLSNSKSWEFDFSSTLVFPRPPHVQYTVESTSGYPRSVLRPVNGTQIVIETEEAVDATVTVWASQTARCHTE